MGAPAGPAQPAVCLSHPGEARWSALTRTGSGTHPLALPEHRHACGHLSTLLCTRCDLCYSLCSCTATPPSACDVCPGVHAVHWVCCALCLAGGTGGCATAGRHTPGPRPPCMVLPGRHSDQSIRGEHHGCVGVGDGLVRFSTCCIQRVPEGTLVRVTSHPGCPLRAQQLLCIAVVGPTHSVKRHCCMLTYLRWRAAAAFHLF